MIKDKNKILEIDNAEYIPKLEKAHVSVDSPPGFVFMKIIFSDPKFNTETREMQNIKREPIQSFMHENVAKDLLKQLEQHFYGNSERIRLSLKNT
ncbi:hypothetical protein [Providencia rettgeri]|uniref:hypothetical protein n=1 Tax=Providencia rettgeri TaxID=587 RepID=UPI001BABBA3E|nr:hypothetical protein [Providencia rettgeri]MBS0875200.1 hypothetical protein [Providencia rettgeri]MBS0921502.1 hypothetical protein [Providencia rettgeri]